MDCALMLENAANIMIARSDNFFINFKFRINISIERILIKYIFKNHIFLI
jgi:hypothetical protein